MPVPKRKKSKSKCRMRRAEDRLKPTEIVRPCPQCGDPMLMHRVCASCGFYRGKEIIEIPIE